MKKLLFLSGIALISFSNLASQEWLYSIEDAKKIALQQNKLLYVKYYDSNPEVADYKSKYFHEPFRGDSIYINFMHNNFVLLRIDPSRSWEQSFYFKNKNYRAIFDSHLILDPNLNQLKINTKIRRMTDDGLFASKLTKSRKVSERFYEDMKPYCLNTSFLKQELKNYSEQQNFNTAFSLGSKYLDFALLVPLEVKRAMVDLADVYFKEAMVMLKDENIENKLVFEQRESLLKIKSKLIIGNSKRALKLLKNINANGIYDVNQSLYSSLYFVSYKLLNNSKEADLYRNNISEIDLKKSMLILDNYNI